MNLAEAINAARAYLDPKDVDCLVYHDPCVDGSSAALAAWIACGESIEYIPKDYAKPFNEAALRDKNVILIDTSFTSDEFQRVSAIAKKVVVLDHHDTAQKNLGTEPGCFFVMENSGALLGWHYFNGLDTPAPRFFQLVEDRDLWRWTERENSEPLFYALNDLHKLPDFKQYAAYVEPAALEEAIQHGKLMLADNKRYCALAAERAQWRRFTPPGTETDYIVMAMELDSEKLYSEIAEHIYMHNDVDMVVLWFKLPDGTFKLSLRNNKPEINVADIAQLFGGGGHPRAAGAKLVTSPWELLREL